MNFISSLIKRKKIKEPDLVPATPELQNLQILLREYCKQITSDVLPAERKTKSWSGKPLAFSIENSDPTSLVVSICEVVPQLGVSALEDEAIAQDVINFLKLASSEFGSLLSVGHCLPEAPGFLPPISSELRENVLTQLLPQNGDGDDGDDTKLSDVYGYGTDFLDLIELLANTPGRVEAVNRGQFTSVLVRCLHILTNTTEDLSFEFTTLVGRIVQLICTLTQYESTLMELIRSHEMQVLFLMIKHSDERRDYHVQQDAALSVLLSAARSGAAQIPGVAIYLRRHSWLKILLLPLSKSRDLSPIYTVRILELVKELVAASCHEGDQSTFLLPHFESTGGYDILMTVALWIVSLVEMGKQNPNPAGHESSDEDDDESTSAKGEEKSNHQNQETLSSYTLQVNEDVCRPSTHDDGFDTIDQCMDRLFQIINDMVYVCREPLEIKVTLHNTPMNPRPRKVSSIDEIDSTTRVGNIKAFAIFQRVFADCKSDTARVAILNRILVIFALHPDNFILVRNLHPVAYFIELLPRLNKQLQKLVLKILEYIVSVVNDVPFEELCALSDLLKHQKYEPETRPTTQIMRMVLDITTKFVNFSAPYKDVFRETGMLEILVLHIKRLAKTLESSDADTETSETLESCILSDNETYVCALETLQLLLDNNSQNMNVFRTACGHDAIYSLVKSRKHRPAAIRVIRHHLDANNISDMLELLQNARDDYDLQISLMQSFCQMLTDGAHVRNSWRDIGGFTSVLFVLASLDDLFQPGDFPDGSDHLDVYEDALTICSPQTTLKWHMLEWVFKVLTAAIATHPINRYFLWSHSGWESIASGTNLSGVLKTPFARNMVELTIDLATEQLAVQASVRLSRATNADKSLLGSTLVRNPEAILLLLDILRHMATPVQLLGLRRVVALIHIESARDGVPIYRNKESLAQVGAVHYFLKYFGHVLNTPKGKKPHPLYELGIKFVEGIGAHRISAPELKELIRCIPSSTAISLTFSRMLQSPPTCPFFEFQMITKSFACLELPTFAVDRFWPNTTGYSFVFWLNIQDDPRDTKIRICELATAANDPVFEVSIEQGQLHVTCSTQATVAFTDFGFVPKRWYHIAILHERKSVTKRGNGELRILVNGRQKGLKRVNFNTAQISLKNIKGYIGTPQNHASRSRLVWWLGSCFFLDGVLDSSQVHSMFVQGPAHCGVFHTKSSETIKQTVAKQMELLESIDLMESDGKHSPSLEKTTTSSSDAKRLDISSSVIFSFHAHSVKSLTDLKSLSDEPKSSEDLKYIMSYAGSTDPGIVVPNSSSHRSGVNTPLAYLCGGAYCINALNLEDSIRMIGGIQSLFPFIDKTKTSDELQSALALLVSFLYRNKKNLKEMARIRGYEIVAHFLKTKTKDITTDCLFILCALVEGRDPHDYNVTVATDSDVLYYRYCDRHNTELELSLKPVAAHQTPKMKQPQFYKMPTTTAQTPMTFHQRDHTMSAADTSFMPTLSMPPRNAVSVVKPPGSVHGTSTSRGTRNHRRSRDLQDLEIGSSTVARKKGKEASNRRRSVIVGGIGGVGGVDFSRGPSGSHGGMSRVLANVLAVKHILFDVQVWSRTDPNVQSALYRWLVIMIQESPSIREMSILNRTRLKFEFLSDSRNWNAQKLREMDVIKHILHIFTHPNIAKETYSPLAGLLEVILLDNLRKEDLVAVSSYLAMGVGIQKRRRGTSRAVTPQDVSAVQNKVQSEAMTIQRTNYLLFNPKSSNSKSSVPDIEPNSIVFHVSPVTVAPKCASIHVCFGYATLKILLKFIARILSAPEKVRSPEQNESLKLVQDIIDARWFSVFLEKRIHTLITGAAVRILYSFLVQDRQFETRFQATKGFVMLKHLIPPVYPSQTLYYCLFGLLIGQSPNTPIPSVSRLSFEIYSLKKDFLPLVRRTKRFVPRVLPTILELIHHNVISAAHESSNPIHIATAVNFLSHLCKYNEDIRVRSEFLNGSTNIESLVKSLFRVTEYLEEKPATDSVMPNYDLPSMEQQHFNVEVDMGGETSKKFLTVGISITKMLGQLIQKSFKKYKHCRELAQRILEAYPGKNEHVRIRLFQSKITSGIIEDLRNIIKPELVLTSATFLGNLYSICELIAVQMEFGYQPSSVHETPQTAVLYAIPYVCVIDYVLHFLTICTEAADQRANINVNSADRSYNSVDNLEQACVHIRNSVHRIVLCYFSHYTDEKEHEQEIEFVLSALFNKSRALYAPGVDCNNFILGIIYHLRKFLVSDNKKLRAHSLGVWESLMCYQTEYVRSLFVYKVKGAPEEKCDLITNGFDILVGESGEKYDEFQSWLDSGALATVQKVYEDRICPLWIKSTTSKTEEIHAKKKFITNETHKSILKRTNLTSQERKLAQQYARERRDYTDMFQQHERVRQHKRRMADFYRENDISQQWMKRLKKLGYELAFWQIPDYNKFDRWKLDFTEGPHRMRKRAKRHDDFYEYYGVDPQDLGPTPDLHQFLSAKRKAKQEQESAPPLFPPPIDTGDDVPTLNSYAESQIHKILRRRPKTLPFHTLNDRLDLEALRRMSEDASIIDPLMRFSPRVANRHFTFDLDDDDEDVGESEPSAAVGNVRHPKTAEFRSSRIKSRRSSDPEFFDNKNANESAREKVSPKKKPKVPTLTTSLSSPDVLSMDVLSGGVSPANGSSRDDRAMSMASGSSVAKVGGKKVGGKKPPLSVPPVKLHNTLRNEQPDVTHSPVLSRRKRTSTVTSFSDDELTDAERILRMLQPGDNILTGCIYNCATISGLDKNDGIVVMCESNLYILANYFKSPSGEIMEREMKEKDASFIANLKYDVLTPGATDLAPVVTIDKTSNFSATGELEEKKEKPKKRSRVTSCEKWAYNQIRGIQRRRYQLQAIGIEFFHTNGCNFLLVFENERERESVYQKVSRMELSDALYDVSVSLTHLDTITSVGNDKQRFRGIGKSVQKRWLNGEMSNFGYLMFLNTLAGRSYNDLTQYPVFPWVLSEYESETLNLSDASIYRDLSKPMGALDPIRAEDFVERYRNWEDPEGKIPKFHYGTHYSSSATVLYYLIRLEPFTRLAVELQSGKFDHADRLFYSIPRTWSLASSKGGLSDVKELTPEFYCLPQFLENRNRFDFDETQRGTRINDTELPPWAHGSAQLFIEIHRAALESEYVSKHLHEWIDLIFGYKQRGKAAEKALNVFYHLTYEDAVDIDSIKDENERISIAAQINSFGQTPPQLFRKPHPQRKIQPAPVTVFSNPELLQADWHKHCDKSVSAIWFNGDKLIAVEGSRQLIPPLFRAYLSWGPYSDGSLRFCTLVNNSNGPVDRVTSVHESIHDGELSCVVVTDDGTLAITGGVDSVVAVWSLSTADTLDIKARLCAHDDRITALAVSVEYRVLISGGDDCQVIIWDLNSLTYVNRLPTHCSPISAITIDKLSGNIITCADTTLSVWDVNGECLAEMRVSESIALAIHSVALAKSSDICNESVIITGHRDGALRFWNLVPTTQNYPQLSVSPTSSSPSGSRGTRRNSTFTGFGNFNSSGVGVSEGEQKTDTFDDEHKHPMTLRLKHQASSHKCKVTSIHTSHYDRRRLWSADARGTILEWNIYQADDHWLPDNEVTNCQRCKRTFGLMDRRHHCRSCGGIFCSKCSRNKLALPQFGYSEKVRVCDFCHMQKTNVRETA